MIYLKLFLNFLMIGALSFGGGYGMVSLVRETVISNGWLTESEFLNFIAVSESTPGPLAVNMATFIGSTQGGILGSFLATLGVVLPSFIIILLIAAVLKNLMKYAGVNAFLSGVRPCVIVPASGQDPQGRFSCSHQSRLRLLLRPRKIRTYRKSCRADISSAAT